MKIKSSVEYEVVVFFQPITDDELDKGHYAIIRNMGAGDLWCGPYFTKVEAIAAARKKLNP